MAVYWPGTLPDKWLLGVTYAPQSQVIRTQMDAGPGKVRRRTSASVTHVDVPVRFTGAEVATFQSWFADELGGGALSFTWKHPLTGVAATYRFRDAPPQWALEIPGDRFSSRWTATLALELLS